MLAPADRPRLGVLLRFQHRQRTANHVGITNLQLFVGCCSGILRRRVHVIQAPGCKGVLVFLVLNQDIATPLIRLQIPASARITLEHGCKGAEVGADLGALHAVGAPLPRFGVLAGQDQLVGHPIDAGVRHRLVKPELRLR